MGVQPLFSIFMHLFLYFPVIVLVQEVVVGETGGVDFLYDGVKFFFQFLDVLLLKFFFQFLDVLLFGCGDVDGFAALFGHPHLFQVVEAVVFA